MEGVGWRIDGGQGGVGQGTLQVAYPTEASPCKQVQEGLLIKPTVLCTPGAHRVTPPMPLSSRSISSENLQSQQPFLSLEILMCVLRCLLPPAPPQLNPWHLLTATGAWP